MRQAANLTGVKGALWHTLLQEIPYDPSLSIVDSFPVCRFAGEAAYGYDDKQIFYGFRSHLHVCWPGVIVAVDLAPANVHDLAMLEEMAADAQGWLLGDRNFWSPPKQAAIAAQGLHLCAPFKHASHPGPAGWSKCAAASKL